MQHTHSPISSDRAALTADSDAWSFEFDTNEDAAQDHSSPHDTSRVNARKKVRREEARTKYSSPPPDYRSSVKDRRPQDGSAPGLVPSFYNVGALYTSHPNTVPPEPACAPDLDSYPPITPSVSKDVSTKPSSGFQKVLKGWDDYNAKRKKRSLFRINRGDGSKAQKRHSMPLLTQETQLEAFSSSATPAYHELPADAGSHFMKEDSVSSPQVSEVSSVGVIGDSRPTLNAADRVPLDDATRVQQQSSPSTPELNSDGRRPKTSSLPKPSIMRRKSSQESRRTLLEDVPEHDHDDIAHDVNSSTFYSEPTLPRYAGSYIAAAASAYINILAQGLKGLHGLLPVDPPVPKGHTRVRWTCRCGARLFDDFVENMPGAADKLEAQLNQRPRPPRMHRRMHSAHMRTRGSGGSSVPSRSGSNGGSSIFSAASSQSSATSTGDIGDMSLNGGGASPSSGWSKQNFSASQSNSPHLVRLGTESEVPWLLTCCAESRLTPKLTHLSMDPSTVASDRDVALALRRHYESIHSSLGATLRLRGLKSIDFVKFEVHRNRFTDIRAKPHMPPYPHPSALPGYDAERPENISWAQTTDYAFEPGHLVPPVGPHYLMHLFAHPHDYDTETVTLKRIPKKLGGRLEFGVGWGVELVEGFVASRVWALLFGLMVVASATFVGVWLTRGDRGDVQGAFAVAGWVVACIGVLGGWIGAAAE